MGPGRQGLSHYDTDMDVDALTIRLYPDAALMQVAAVVDPIDADTAALAARMLSLMHEADGVGLAAPQVGILQRVFVTRDSSQATHGIVWVNPVLEVIDETLLEDSEGCLSLPDIDVNVRRPQGVRITGRNLDGDEVTCTSDEYIARVWQHECDHLDGRLIIDRMSTMDRLRNRKAMRAMLKRAR